MSAVRVGNAYCCNIEVVVTDPETVDLRYEALPDRNGAVFQVRTSCIHTVHTRRKRSEI